MNVTRSAGLAFAAILLSTSLASAGSFLDFGSGGGDGGSSGGDSILDMIDDPSDEPDQNSIRSSTPSRRSRSAPN